MLEYESYIISSHKMKVNTEVVVLVCVGIKIPFIRPVRSFLQSSGCIYTACSEAFMEYFCTPAP